MIAKLIRFAIMRVSGALAEFALARASSKASLAGPVRLPVPLKSAIAEIARVVEPGGRFLLFLNHPLLQAPGSGWIDDHILDEQYWRIGPYLVEDHSMEEVAPGVVLPFIHRPLSAYVNALAEHGLVIERMEEPAPPPGFIVRAPEYASAATIPRLLYIRARRTTPEPQPQLGRSAAR